MIKTLSISMLLISNCVIACGTSELFEFGAYSTDGINHKHGSNVSIDGTKVIIDTRFINELIENPSGKELQNNRDELFYLIASGNKRALLAGIKVLSNLIQHPEFITGCGGSKEELWEKEEIAFVVSRNFDFADIVCTIPKNEYDIVVSFYRKNPTLWGQIYDPIWMEGNSPNCNFGK